MPRNSSGIYTLPAGNPVVSGTTIDAAWANSTLEDLANEITNSLSRTGAGGMLAPFRIADGTVTAPGLSFLNETNSGLYRIGAAEVGVAIGGAQVSKWTASGLLVPVGKSLTVAGITTLSGTVNATGALNASDLNAVHIDMDTGGSTGAVARLKWNSNDGTLDIGMGGGNVTQQVGLEQFYHVRATANIAPGEVVMSTGTLGASGRITAAPAVGNINPEYVMGVATESIASGADGYITSFGLVRDIDTTGGAEAWTDGTVLYFNPSTAGGLTKTIPTAPNPKVIVAIVVRAHATTGSLFIRVTHGSVFGSTDSNVEFTTLAANNMIKYNASASRWENVAGPAGAIVGTTDSQTLTNKTISGGTVSGASVINLSTPVNSTDAATKAYVDSVAEGIDAKASCVVATTANITLSGTQTIDGVAVGVGDRVLVKNQANTAENGIYMVASGTWARSTDANTWSELVAAYTFVERGTTQASNGYICTVAAGGTLGVTSVTWSQFSGAGQIDAGAGLTKSGNTLAVGTASTGRIVVNADNIDLATTGLVAGTYRSVTADAYGRITAGTNPTTLAGYGITDAYDKTYIDTLYGSTASAAASAADALTYKNAAQTSASNAATSESNALTYKNAAQTSAGNAATSESNAAGSAASALSSLTTFRSQYLGASATDPTVDGNGNALTAGDLYYNTAVNEMRVYSGSAWLAAYLPATGYLALSGGTMTGAIAFDASQTWPTFNQNTTGTASNVTGTVAIANGGTGQTSQTAAFDALAPTTTKGDLIVSNGTDNVRLAVGTDTHVLTADSSQASGVKWAAVAGGVSSLSAGTGISVSASTGAVTVTNTGVTSLSGTTNQVSVSGSTGSITLSTPQSIATSSSVQFGSFGVGTAASGTTGEIRATDNITAYYSSDARLKENVREIPDALSTVQAIGGKLFDWKDSYIQAHGGADGYFVRKADFGVIAQDVAKVFPVAVREREDGTLAVDYEKLVAVAFAAIKELCVEVKALKGE